MRRSVSESHSVSGTERRLRSCVVQMKTSSSLLMLAAHDLQSPLRTVCQFAELLRRDSQAGQSENTKNYIDIIARSDRAAWRT